MKRGQSPAAGTLADRFFRGHYGEVVAETYDADRIPPDAVHFVVGALTFLNRVDDAYACFASYARVEAPGTQRALDARIRTACRFFFGLASARSGDFDRSHRQLVTEAFAARRGLDSWSRALLFQGLACQCYFTGRYHAATRFALRALHAAHDAHFVYATMLSTDLRGHAFVQMGQLQRGVALLQQAKSQAHRLGFDKNVYAIECSVVTYASMFMPQPEVLRDIEQLLQKHAHDSYSHRALLTEAATQLALRGRAREALASLALAEKDALRGDSRRGKIVSLLARLAVTRWHQGPAACAPLVDAALALIDERDTSFRADALAYDALVGLHTHDDRRHARALRALQKLEASSHHFRARAALQQLATEWSQAAAFAEDELSPLLRAVVHRDVSVLPRLLSLGLLGAIPEMLGLPPSRRILVIPSERVVLLEDRGDLVVRERPPRWVPTLLQALATGHASKQTIVSALWGIRTYAPERHDPPLRTSISRLRAFLQPHGHWLTAADDGYDLEVPIVVVGPTELVEDDAPLFDEGETPDALFARPSDRRGVAAHPVSNTAARSRDRATQERLVLARLQDTTSTSVDALARGLGLSESTVLRVLRRLQAEGHVVRRGFARATTYAIA